MISASRIWIACEERNGSMRSQVPQSLWTLPGPWGIPLCLCHTSFHMNAFLFCVPTAFRFAEIPVSLSSSHLPGSFRFTFLTLIPNYLMSPVLPIYLAPDRFNYNPDLLASFLRTGTANYSPLTYSPSVAPASYYYPHPSAHTFSTFSIGFCSYSSAHFSKSLKFADVEWRSWGEFCVPSALQARASLEVRVI